MLKEVFMAFDEDGSGTLSEDELKKAVSSFDKDGNGRIDAGEVEEAMSKAGLTQRDLDELIK